MKAAKRTKARRMAGLLAVGAKAPNFRLPRDGGGSVGLKDFQGRKLVVYFYPRAGTAGCTRESVDFNRLRPQFQRADTAILGVSADPVPAQERFRDAHDLGFPLLSDEFRIMLQAYGVWAKKHLYGRTFMGIVRTTYLIDGNGRIAGVWPRVKVADHAEEVLAAARSL
jgi:peroxiredoxin Q/BCP